MTTDEIARALGNARREGGSWRCLCPAHDDTTPSLSITEKNGKMLVICRAGCKQGAVLNALRRRGLWPEPRERNRKTSGIAEFYDYRDAEGALRYQVVRRQPKSFFQRRPNGADGSFINNIDGVEPLPYRLPQLLAAPADCTVFIVEGERDADNLGKLGLTASCNNGGAGQWRVEISRWFSGRNVVILPDNDDLGRKHGQDVAQKLASITARIKIIGLPDLPPKGDVSDWITSGGTREALERLAADAPVFSLEDGGASADHCDDHGDDGAEIARLAALPPIQCDREIPAVAKNLGCRVSTLRAAVKAERGNGAAIPGQGRPLDLPEPEPWPQPVDGAELLHKLARAIRRHVVLDKHEADAVALWVLAAHAFDVWVIFPRLFITAPEKQCGKTTLLDVLSRLVPRPLMASGITAAALFRTIEAARPTLLLDEADAYARDNEDLRAVLDAGHRRDGAVIRTVGDNHEPRQFSAWAPVALAAIWHLHGTIEDRSIIVRLRRRRPDEPVDSLRLDRAGVLDQLASKTARWTADQRGSLVAADTAMPTGIYNRAADNWRPLLAIADLAGDGWAERGRHAAVALSGQGEDSESARVLLLADLRQLFLAEPSGVLFTSEILSRLHARDDRPWPEYRGGRPITARQMATQLRPLGVATNQTVRRGAERSKGYRAEDMADAWSRYLPAVQIGDAVTTRRNPRDSQFPIGDKPGADGDDVTDENLAKATESGTCHRVTDAGPLLWRDRL